MHGYKWPINCTRTRSPVMTWSRRSHHVVAVCRGCRRGSVAWMMGTVGAGRMSGPGARAGKSFGALGIFSLLLPIYRGIGRVFPAHGPGALVFVVCVR